MTPRPAVFLDRDGTLITETGYLSDPSTLRLFPGAAQAVRLLREEGWLAVLITNQSGIARGLLDEPTLGRVHDRLEQCLAEGGARLDGIFYCPHHPEVGQAPYRRECTCRKPAPGLLLQARQELDIDLGRSWMVGDAPRDIEAGRRAGVRGLLVETGKGRAALEGMTAAEREALPHAADVLEAVRWILASS